VDLSATRCADWRRSISNHRKGLLKLQHRFAGVKRFRMIAGRGTFHPSQAHESKKGVALKPVLSVLRLERIEDVTNFALIHFRRERHVKIWPAHIAIVLWNLVFKDQVVSKCVGGEFGDQAMILVGIALPVRENQIGLDLTLYLFEIILHLAAAVGQKTVAKVFESDRLLATGSEELRSFCGFLAAKSCGTENHPVEPHLRERALEIEQRAAASNFDIVAVGAKAEDGQSSIGIVAQVEREHELADL
jgi:hypothetical protein